MSTPLIIKCIETTRDIEQTALSAPLSLEAANKENMEIYFSVVLKKPFSFLHPQYPSVRLKYRINIGPLRENLLSEDLAELHSLLVE